MHDQFYCNYFPCNNLLYEINEATEVISASKEMKVGTNHCAKDRRRFSIYSLPGEISPKLPFGSMDDTSNVYDPFGVLYKAYFAETSIDRQAMPSRPNFL